MEFGREKYLNKLVAHIGNQRVKIITGIRRCGKSYLLFELFRRKLIESGNKPSHILEIKLDDRTNKALRDPDVCLEYIHKKIKDKKPYFLLIDEVQMMAEFEDVLNSCLAIRNLDTYVTGSNSRFLSKDVITEFRGRGDEIHLWPLTFSEFADAQPQLTFQKAWDEYSLYGGLPYCAQFDNHEEKTEYLKNLFVEVYLKDILERNRLQRSAQMEQLVKVIASGIGSLTNLRKLENTFKSEEGIQLSVNTIGRYLEMLEDAFIVHRADRYDVRGRKYIATQQKYYFTDPGLRNALLNFRQYEETHLMENVIYNELCARGYSVDVGVVEINEQQNDRRMVRKQVEIDFVCNKGPQRVYIQSAFALPTMEKEIQEKRPFSRVDDSFQKIVLVKDDISLRKDEEGVITMGLPSFLLNPLSLEH